MKISELKLKEDFEAIFSKTVQKFFLDYHQLSLEVNFKRACYRGGFFQNDRLNFIWHKDLSWVHYISVVGEYRHADSLFLRFARMAYIAFCFCPLLRWLLNSGSVTITTTGYLQKSIGFIPGNHSIRIVDFAEDICWVLKKEGSDSAFLEQEVLARRICERFSPALISSDKDFNWLCEERIVGFPVDRVAKAAALEPELNKFLSESLTWIYMRERVETPFLSYTNFLWVEVLEKLKETDIEADALHNLKDWALEEKFPLDQQVTIALSHGDLQRGNIYRVDEHFLLIDWEYSTVRSVFYDALVFEADVRRIEGFGSRLVDIYLSPSYLEKSRAWSKWTGSAFRPEYCYLFLLEEVLLRIQESSSGGFRSTDALISVLREVEFFCSGIAVHNGGGSN
ncbi:hypothetical protein N9O15_02125 [Gammaproteobacteria bacterium]|nr:hypothetical protein [Gammaproteobacteria bacterium]